MTQSKIAITEREPADKVSILDIRGEFTGSAEQTLMAAYSTASGGGANAIILNFTKVETMNSAGAGLLIALLAHAQRQKQRLLAYGLAESLKDAFVLTHLDEAIGLYADESEALKSVAH